MDPQYYRCTVHQNNFDIFNIPKNYKRIFAFDDKIVKNVTADERAIMEDVNDILSTGPKRENYIRLFHTLLWYDETLIKNNLSNYNKTGVPLRCEDKTYILNVPSLAEKRPSLMIGDFILIIPQKSQAKFEGVIHEIWGTDIHIQGLHADFTNYFERHKKFDIQFILCRVSLERMHIAIQDIKNAKQESKTFPSESRKLKKIAPILSFYNPLIASNVEQRIAVEHIVSNSSGRAPYLVHGPPGTGKTVTIVEAILQLVKKNHNNRILVCTDSNMAADHLAVALIKFNSRFPQNYFLLRVNSKMRAWDTLPECLAPYSNGTSYQNHMEIALDELKSYRIVVITLQHSATYASRLKSERENKYITHLFIDEAAQASEPACLIPICGLLSVTGSLVLAGDPQQLGPIVMSQTAKQNGLSTSLMERLQKSFPMYKLTDSNCRYTVMLRNNFRSDPDILLISNELFYENKLNAMADSDPLSAIDLIDGGEGRAISFHGVLSMEQKTKATRSFCNRMEFDIVQFYVYTLVAQYQVLLEDIGIVTPYIRQASIIRTWLLEQGYEKIEVGTVEAFQGKEKRIIIISTVRANPNMLNHDSKYQLGFLVEDKRFNVALTRAKAKVIIIGNPICLSRDIKWRKYMDLCRDFGSYHGDDYE